MLHVVGIDRSFNEYNQFFIIKFTLVVYSITSFFHARNSVCHGRNIYMYVDVYGIVVNMFIVE